MKKHIFVILFTLICPFFIISCHQSYNTDADYATAVADSFAQHYFTWHFAESFPYADATAQKHIIFAASNVHDADIEILHSTIESPNIEVTGIILENDSEAYASVTMSNIILMDTLGKKAHMHPEVKKQLILKRKAGENWKVTAGFY